MLHTAGHNNKSDNTISLM